MNPLQNRIRNRIKFRNVSVGLVMFSFVLACIPPQAESELSNPSFSFSVMGDVPRGEAEIAILDTQIAKFNQQSSSSIVFHLGDFKRGSEPCDEDVYRRVSTQLKKIDRPVFMLMGDNEWNDCSDPEMAWSHWFKYYTNFENNWDHDLKVEHQPEQLDNFSFEYAGILFIGLNIVGSRIHDQSIWNEIESSDIDWMRYQFENTSADAIIIVSQANPALNHPNLLMAFQRLAETYENPILFLHGDGHHWTYDEAWEASNITKIQIDKGGIADPLEITFHRNRGIPFTFDRHPFQSSKEKI